MTKFEGPIMKTTSKVTLGFLLKLGGLGELLLDIVTWSLAALHYHLTTIWLFTLSDLKTIVGPKAVFGIVGALSGAVLTKDASPSFAVIASRIPVTIFWAWINLLPFAIDNQRQPDAIAEDRENKPWRSMPSHRLSQKQAKYLMLTLYPVALVASFGLGGLKQCVSLILLGYWYNDLGGADRSCISRNFINACGFICYASGAMEVTSRTDMLDTPFNEVAGSWFMVIGAIVFTSVQSQDMYDQTGDSVRGRATVPLVLGDSVARWTIAIPVAVWSWVCPAFWQLGVSSYTLSVGIGAVIIFRTLTRRTVPADKLTFRLWNLWMVVFYFMPLMKRFQSTLYF